VGGVIFLMGCRSIQREIERSHVLSAEPIHELPRTGTLGR
jgi:hypothetical protein